MSKAEFPFKEGQIVKHKKEEILYRVMGVNNAWDTPRLRLTTQTGTRREATKTECKKYILSYRKSFTPTKEDIEALKKLPFIYEASLSSGSLNLWFRETYFKMPTAQVMFFWLGKLKVKIYNNGSIDVYGEFNRQTPNHYCPHAPHGSCFGNVTDYRIQLMNSCKFVDVANLVWAWLKVNRPGDGGRAPKDEYRRYAEHKWPVFNEKGIRLPATIPEKGQVLENEFAKKYRDLLDISDMLI